MKTAVEAKALTDDNINNLTFVLDLITGATSNGFYSIVIEDYRMTDEICDILRNTWGYTVYLQNFSNTEYKRYTIDWTVPVVI